MRPLRLLPLAPLLALLLALPAPPPPDGAGIAFVQAPSPAAIARALEATGARWWFEFGAPPGGERAPGQVELVRTGKGRPKVDATTLAAAARARPGRAWLIGNEPNIPGQDEIAPADFAAEFDAYARAITGADPTARVVAPNVQNFGAPCVGCENVVPGDRWVGEFRRAYTTRFGAEPPIDAWGLHLYNVNWERLPMVDADESIAQVRRLRAYLDADPATRGRPIWVTELGVIWGFEGYEAYQSLDGAARLRPVGAWRGDAVAAYLDQLLAFFAREGRALRVERWFVFANVAYREPYADAPAGIALLEDASSTAALTPLGQIMRVHGRSRAVTGGT